MGKYVECDFIHLVFLFIWVWLQLQCTIWDEWILCATSGVALGFWLMLHITCLKSCLCIFQSCSIGMINIDFLPQFFMKSPWHCDSGKPLTPVFIHKDAWSSWCEGGRSREVSSHHHCCCCWSSPQVNFPAAVWGWCAWFYLFISNQVSSWGDYMICSFFSSLAVSAAWHMYKGIWAVNSWLQVWKWAV